MEECTPRGCIGGANEFPTADTFTYKANKANTSVHTKNKISLLQDRQPDNQTRDCHPRMSWVPHSLSQPSRVCPRPGLESGIPEVSSCQPPRNQAHTNRNYLSDKPMPQTGTETPVTVTIGADLRIPFEVLSEVDSGVHSALLSRQTRQPVQWAAPSGSILWDRCFVRWRCRQISSG